jgi:hypothetical protein
MSETPGEYAAVPTSAKVALFTRYAVIADGRVLYEGEEWNRAYRTFFDHAHNGLIRDLQCVVKRRPLPASGQYPDIVW